MERVITIKFLVFQEIGLVIVYKSSINFLHLQYPPDFGLKLTLC